MTYTTYRNAMNRKRAAERRAEAVVATFLLIVITALIAYCTAEYTAGCGMDGECIIQYRTHERV